MKSFFLKSVLTFMIYSHLNASPSQLDETITLILDMENIETLPEHFRSSSDALHFSPNPPNNEGLTNLKASGCAQFSKKALNAILQRLGSPSRCTVVDLRQESHGFLNGAAISWFALKDRANRNKSLEQIISDETMRLHELRNEHEVTVYRITKKNADGGIASADPLLFKVEGSASEEEITLQSQLDYIRIPVADHARPSDDVVERFIAFVKELPKDTWLHFHCETGEGRTTTFMIMYDMMRNSQHVSLSDIINRQWLLGGFNMMVLPTLDDWKFDLAIERILFLKTFYQYCKENQGSFKQSWQTYLQKQEIRKELTR